MAYYENNERRVRIDIAKKEAEKLTNIYSSPPIPVLEIAESNGVNVVFTDFGSHSEEVSGFCDFKNARLFVNANDNMKRKLFTIAHELGHWILHRELFLTDPEKYPILPRFKKVDFSNKYEQEANAFAANLLVPTKLLMPVKSFPPAVLANIFSVSITMMEHRLKNG